MDELGIVLRQHAGRYRLMEPTDAVKLIYQNEFGGGNMPQRPTILKRNKWKASETASFG